MSNINLIAHITDGVSKSRNAGRRPHHKDSRPWDRHRHRAIFEKFVKGGLPPADCQMVLLRDLWIPQWALDIPTLDPFSVVRFRKSHGFQWGGYSLSIIFLSSRDRTRFALMSDGSILSNTVETYSVERGAHLASVTPWLPLSAHHGAI